MPGRDAAQQRRLSEFGDSVRSRRAELGLSQESLADRAGLHRTYLGSVERGERNVSLINLFAIADALNVEPAVLLSRQT